MTRVLTAAALAWLAAPALAQGPTTARTEDVIYGRKHGVALTLDVFTPEKPNRAAVVHAVSGGWFSRKEGVSPQLAAEFTARGYTVFAVVHGSNPRFSIPEVLDDMHRAVQFIRANADKYGIDPDRIGIYGASAGGHLSLMQATAPKPGDPNAKDPVERASSKVRAAGLFYPPTDFLNYGKAGENALGVGTLAAFKGAFDFREYDPKTRSLEPVTDPDKRAAIGKAISPAYHVSKASAPALVIHGDADKLVPIQQAELVRDRYKAAGVPFELVVKKGAAHGWPDQQIDRKLILDWFDTRLAGGK